MIPPIAFSRPLALGGELERLREAIAQGKLSGNGPFTQLCQSALEKSVPGARALLTHSGTAALEMCAILTDLAPGDEVIMPSYTFVSTANAVVLRGAIPVFVDIRPDTLNIDERCIEAAITPRTRAIFVVHYAGVSCEMAEILAIARKHGLFVVEDAAQAYGASYHGKALGSLGTLAALSFHDTKNVISGEGGALLINDPALVRRAEIIWEKGTDRVQFARGEVGAYTWCDLGSSFLPSELIAAYLSTQLEAADVVTRRRLDQWRTYHEMLAPLELKQRLTRPSPPEHAGHNGHIYFVLLKDSKTRDSVAAALRERGIGAVWHYIPLHSSPAGRRFGRAHGNLSVTDDVSARLLRLPLHHGLTSTQQRRVVDALSCLVEPPGS